VFVNPPYGRNIKDWIAKAEREQHNGCTVVMVLMACTDTLWWKQAWARASEVRLLTGRVKFLDTSGLEVASAPKGTAIIIWHPFGEERHDPKVSLVDWR
jgi:site-specific DNA-methyltransferase (adenine-specific)